jgi:AbrB family looped-hinge helix DNA binding protein
MPQVRARLDQGGRVVIPADYRRALGLHPGEEVILRLEDGEVRMLSLSSAIRRAQELVRRHVAAGRSLSDELVAERRAEAARE